MDKNIINSINKKIYIADDEPEIRNVVKSFLDRDGFITEGFDSGDTLLSEFKKSLPDLVILDVMMPGTSGFAVCKEIRKTSDVPIIMLTARDSDLDYATAMSLGSNYYFTKPFSGLELSGKVKDILNNKESLNGYSR
ncbi:MAG: response regulator [Clostridia bacterium]